MLVLALVLALATASSLHQQLNVALPGYGLSEGELWRQSVTAALAGQTAQAFCDAPLPAESFTAALLHGVGKLVLGRFLDEELGKIEINPEKHSAGTGTHNAMAHVTNRWVGAVQVEPSPQLLWRDRGVGRDLDHVASHRVSMGPPRYSITSYQAHMGDGTLASRCFTLLVHSQLSSGPSRSRYFCALCLGYGSCAVGMSGWCSLHHVSPCRSHCSKPRLTNGGETW